MSSFFLRLAVGLLMVGPVVCLAAHAAEPTEYDQFFLELVNRARANPQAEVQRLAANSLAPSGSFAADLAPFPGGPSLNEGPPRVAGGVYTIPAAPKQPLAFNTALLDVTHSYAALCQANNAINHFFNGTTPSGRMIAAGFVPALATNDALEVPPGSGQMYYPGDENLAGVFGELPWTSTDYPGDRRREAVEAMHHVLFVDGSTPGRGHRVTMMVGDYREVGVGMDFGTDPGGWFSAYGVMDVGHQQGRGPFITGVAYRELVVDGFFTPGKGEALGGLAVQIRETGTPTQVAATTTFASGGYGVAVPGGRTYDVVITGAQVSRTIRAVAVGSGNVKVDVIESGAVPAFAVTSITRTGNSATLTWAATPGATYRVAVSTNLVMWSPLANSQKTATATTLSHVDTTAGPGVKFYRVERL